MKTARTLVVVMADDDDDDCMLAKDAFGESGSQVDFLCVEDGMELMEYLPTADPRPALILLDLNMPRQDGRQVLAKIKSDPALRDIPIVVFTTSREEKDMAYSRQMGANSFITKPATFREWVNIMKALAADWLDAE